MTKPLAVSRRSRLTVSILLVLALSACDTVLPRRSTGEKLYRRHCADCHGVDAAGHTIRHMGDPYANLRDAMWRHGGDPHAMENTVKQGLVFRHPSFEQLSGQEVRQIVDHVLALRGEKRR